MKKKFSWWKVDKTMKKRKNGEKLHLTRRQCRFLDRLHHSQRHRLRWCRYVGCTIEADDMVWLNNEELSATVCLLCMLEERRKKRDILLSINFGTFSLSGPFLTCCHIRHFISVAIWILKWESWWKREKKKGKKKGKSLLSQNQIFFIFIVH